MSHQHPEPTASLEQWADDLRHHLGLQDTTPVADVLDLARDAAAALERPAAPVTAFLVGLAAGRAGGTSDSVREAMAAARALMDAERGT